MSDLGHILKKEEEFHETELQKNHAFSLLEYAMILMTEANDKFQVKSYKIASVKYNNAICILQELLYDIYLEDDSMPAEKCNCSESGSQI